MLGTEIKEPPELLKQLIKNEHLKSESFIDNIRRYNSMYAFTSIGENYHFAGTLLPKEGNPPAFSQLYIVDSQNEIRNRMNIFRFYFLSDLKYWFHIITMYDAYF